MKNFTYGSEFPPKKFSQQNLFEQMTNYEQRASTTFNLRQNSLYKAMKAIFTLLLISALSPGAFAQADCCDQGEKPAAITIRYTGDGCEVTTHNQDPDKVQCDGDPYNDAMVYILATEKENGSGKIWFSGNVALGETFVIDAANANQSKLKSKTFVRIFSSQSGSLLQFVEFHTSCSQPLAIGNRFGANQIEGIIFEDGTSCGPGNPNPPAEDCCDQGGKPAVITVTYTGEGCDVTSHTQDPDKVQCDGNPNFDNAVYILATEKEDGSGKIWFSGTVALNGAYNIDAANAGESKLKSKTFVRIFDMQGGNLLQFVEFHTSCSQPIAVGNQFGANRIEGILFDNGVNCGPPPPCDNFCDGGIVGMDEEDCEGYDPEIITELVAPCDDTPPGPQPVADCCEQGDKPAAITVRYTGEGCEATSHTQDPDKVQCDGDPNDDAMVYIVASEKEDGSGKIWFTGNVALNETFVIDAANANQDKLKSKTFVRIYSAQNGSLLQFVEFHTSCSQPLGIGNQFGANLIEGIIFEDGSACGEAGDGVGEDCCDLGGKPYIITATYTGESCASTSHTQDPDKVQCDGNPNFDDSVYILATEKEDGSGKIWFSGTVGLNETFDISAANANQSKLKSKTFVRIYSAQNGSLLQFIEFHTSCSQPLAVGNQFGAVRLENILFDNDVSCGPATPDVEYQWLSSTMGCPDDLSQAIAGANGPSYDPEYIFQTTYYVRLVRKGGCSDAEWVASNCVVKGVTPPCEPCEDQGGDTDGDGVCDEEDCVPDDPFYPNTPGTPCDDGDPHTENDMVTDDGCDCMGTPVDICDNATDGGTIGLGEGGIFSSLAVCIGENTVIQSNAAPSGGSGALEVVWIKSPSVSDCNTAFSELLPFNVGQIYDDFIDAGGYGIADPGIGTTSWMFVNDGDMDDLSLNVNVEGSFCYTRCVRRDGCLTFDGESNIVSIIAEDCVAGPYSVCNNTIIVNGNADANVIQVHDRNAGWTIVYSCGAWTGNGACDDPQAINLPDGSYQLRVIPAGSYSYTIDVTIDLPATCAAPLTRANQGNTAQDSRWNAQQEQQGAEMPTLNTMKPDLTQFELYPNPANDLVNINVNTLLGNDVIVRVVNELGMEVYQQNIDRLDASVLEINTSNWSQGLYIVMLQAGDQAPVAKKLLITKTAK